MSSRNEFYILDLSENDTKLELLGKSVAMETTKVVLFYEKCRLCLDRPGVRNMFEKDSNEDNKNAHLDLPHAIYSCTGVKVSPKDNLPSKICEQCLDVVVKARELRQLAQKNNSHLRSLFSASDDENDELEGKKQQRVADSLSSSTENVEEEVESPNKYYQYDDPPEKHKNMNESPINLRDTKSKSEKHKNISIRKDLFESTTAVSSSTNVSKKDHDSKESLRKRMKLDDGTEYRCGECSKSFGTWKKLYLHQRTHNKTMLCPLDACAKKFATKGDLEKHIRTHTGVKPFVCDICDKGFTQQGTLKTHKETVHYSYIFV